MTEKDTIKIMQDIVAKYQDARPDLDIFYIWYQGYELFYRGEFRKLNVEQKINADKQSVGVIVSEQWERSADSAACLTDVQKEFIHDDMRELELSPSDDKQYYIGAYHVERMSDGELNICLTGEIGRIDQPVPTANEVYGYDAELDFKRERWAEREITGATWLELLMPVVRNNRGEK